MIKKLNIWKKILVHSFDQISSDSMFVSACSNIFEIWSDRHLRRQQCF